MRKKSMTKISPMKPVLDTSKDYSKRKEQLRKKVNSKNKTQQRKHDRNRKRSDGGIYA